MTSVATVAVVLTAALGVYLVLFATDREVAWRVGRPPPESSPPLGAYVTKDAYIRLSEDDLTSYDLATGERSMKRSFAAGVRGPCSAASTLVDGLLVLTRNIDIHTPACETVTAIDVSTGEPAWNTELPTGQLDPGSVDTEAAIDVTSRLAVVAAGKRVHALVLRTGKPRWHHSLDMCHAVDTEIDEASAVVASYCGDDPRDQRLTALDAGDGNRVWQTTYRKRTDTDHEVDVLLATPPVLSTRDGDATSATELRFFDDTGRERAVTPARADDSDREREYGAIDTFRTVGSTVIGVSSITGKAVAFDAPSGKRRWVVETPRDPSFVHTESADDIVVRSGDEQRLVTVDPADGDLDRGRPLPEQAPRYGSYWLSGETLLAVDDAGTPGAGEAWLTAFRPK